MASSIRTIVTTDCATLLYHFDSKIVHQTIHKPHFGPPFREMLTLGVALLEHNSADKWLSDDRGNGALHPDDGKWAMDVWSVRAIAAGWKYWAVVMPDAALGRASMRRFIREYADRGVEVKIFPSPEEALDWLKSIGIAVAV